MKKILIALLVMGILPLTFIYAQNAADKAKTLAERTFDDKNIILRFAAISDTHMQTPNWIPSRKLTKALEQLNAKADGKLDAVLISGDLTDYGMPEQAAELKRVFDNSSIDLNKTRLVFTIGNHEYYAHQLQKAPWKGGYLFRDVFGEQAYNGASPEEIQAANYHATVNGYDFIAVNCDQYESEVKYRDSDIEWLKKQLADAVKNHPGKPVFVTSHPNITGTNLGSNDGSFWAGRDLYYVLKDYPQVIFFCGHLHYSEADERSIWQGEFTTIGLGSTYYLSNHDKDDVTGSPFIDLDGGYEANDFLETPGQGLYLEVDKNNNVRITRMDFTHNRGIKTPWIIPAPKKDNSHLAYYTPAREKITFGKTAPVFPKNAYIKEVSTAKGLYQFEFTQAKDNDMVYCYEVSFIDNATGKVLKTISTLSDFYLYANPSDMSPVLVKTVAKADSVLYPFTTYYEKDYYLQIVALDCFGQKSAPLKSKVIKSSCFGNCQGNLLRNGTINGKDEWQLEKIEKPFINMACVETYENVSPRNLLNAGKSVSVQRPNL